jgi:aspartyl-tRNA synthetase
MSVHTLYQPATVATASSLRKTTALTGAVSNLRVEAAVIETKIADINGAHSPIIEPARKMLLQRQKAFRAVRKRAKEVDISITNTKLQLEELTAKLAELTKAAEAAEAETVEIETLRDAAEKAVTDAEASCSMETAKLRKRHSDLLSETDKAAYRLRMHLARHPASALQPQAEATVNEVASAER